MSGLFTGVIGSVLDGVLGGVLGGKKTPNPDIAKSEKEAKEKKRREELRKKGRGSTLLTGGLGDTSKANTATKILGG